MIRWDDTHDEQISAMSADLVAAYERTSGTPGDVAADALLAEIQRRGLDV